MVTAVDYAARQIDPRAIRDAGHIAVLAYVSTSRPGTNFGAKPLTREYADRIRAAGLDIVSIWQYGKPGNPEAPSDYTLGFEGGARMGHEARERHFAAGGPGYCPIYFAVDEDIDEHTWNTKAVHFFRGVNNAIGQEWTGVYGHDEVCLWAIRDGVVGRSTTQGRYWAWQTKAWSEGDIAEGISLYQRIVDTPSTPGPKIDGTSVDVNDIYAADYGQWSIDRAPRPVAKPEYVELDRMGNSRSSRHGARVTNFLLHTQEGNGTAESLANYLNNTANGVSYHYTVRDGIVCDVVDTDYASWSVLDANPFTINLCFAGSRAGWSRAQWLEREDDVRIAAWLAVQDARKYDFEPVVIPPPYWRGEGISDHKYVTEELGIGTHTDVGYNFIWDRLEIFVNEYAGGGPGPGQGNAINDAAAAAPWLGRRLTPGEIPTPDGVGRRAEFENGQVYWHPNTGAHAIPTRLFEKFAELGWETGPLGWPITDLTILTDAAGTRLGEVQGFQGGALYPRYGADRPPVWVRGAIRDRWNRSGFENGPLGWPLADEQPFDGGAYQRFEHGTIYWPGRRDTVALLGTDGPDMPLPDRD
ncbi:LGFP repeat-containing protein [Nocardia amikacinitolerans]|nr:LGFP repeat-containing protein [Nocardia amikacinitolerans]